MDIQSVFPKISEEQIDRLNTFCRLLKEWNRRINLISRQDGARLWERHIWPSIIPLKFIDIPAGSWILDIGSGGGLPAIPLKILRPDLQILMIESIRKKALFLQKTITDLSLENSTVLNQRVEKLDNSFDLLNRFDIITARAVASIDTLIQWGNPFLKESGSFLLWKAASDLSELTALADLHHYRYEVCSVPEAYRPLSPKFEELRWFKITH